MSRVMLRTLLGLLEAFESKSHWYHTNSGRTQLDVAKEGGVEVLRVPRVLRLDHHGIKEDVALFFRAFRGALAVFWRRL